jgi:hypothetical protein
MLERTPIALTVALALTLLAAPDASRALELTQDEIERLAAGQQIVKPIRGACVNGLYGGTALILVDESPEVVQAAIEDLDSYPQMFPYFVSAGLAGKLDGKRIVRMRQGTAVFNLIYHLLISYDPDKRLTRFRMIKTLPHDIEDVVGFWRLFPQRDGRTVVAYGVTARVNLGALGLIDRVGYEIQKRLVGMPAYLKRWLAGPGKNRYSTSSSTARTGRSAVSE